MKGKGIAPNKPTTIPRLELLAVLIGIRGLKFVESSLQIPIKKKILWTDSTCVLNWIKSNKPLPTFVENRLKEIRDQNDVEYHYVNTKENPADMASRGRKLRDLIKDELWRHGPHWLCEREAAWPHWDITVIDQEMLSNLARIEKGPDVLYEVSITAGNAPSEMTVKKDTESNTPYEIKMEKFSSFNKLVRTTAWVTRFIRNISNKNKVKTGLSAQELLQARLMWIKHVQQETLQQLSSKFNGDNNKLNLQADQEGIVRCHGRLFNIDEVDTTNPIYLPKKSYLTQLIIKDCHERLFHAGASHTLSYIRRTYWIPHGRTEVRSTLLNCRICKRFQEGPFKMPKMSSWPISKITRSAPFSYTGLDYMGPLYAKEAGQKMKVWICLFTCVATRALHLEIVGDMTANQFLMALRRFIARRGTPTEVICDNAKQFKAAKRATDQAWSDVISDQSVYDYVSNQGIPWKFIVEFSPWSGRFYERLVGLVKSSLRKSLGSVCLTRTQLSTIITEVEATLNTRPLNYIDEDINSVTALTPNDFLSPYSKVGIPVIKNDTEVQIDKDFKPSNTKPAEILMETWKKGQAHLNRLWKIWYSHYILSLRERYQTHIQEVKKVSKCEPQIGEIVHVKEELPRGRWKLGRIEELIISKDGETRAAKIRTAHGHVLKRPLTLLYPLELSTSEPNISMNNEQ